MYNLMLDVVDNLLRRHAMSVWCPPIITEIKYRLQSNFYVFIALFFVRNVE